MQKMNQSPGFFPEDEISLLDLWQILRERKALIAAWFLVCVATGAAFVLFKVPVYEASAVLQIGQVKGEGDPLLLEAPEALSMRILAQYGENVVAGIQRELPFIAAANAQRGGAGSLHLTAAGGRPEAAVRLLEDVLEKVQASHASMFEANLSPVIERLKSLDAQQASLRQQYADLTQLAERLKQRDSVQASLLMIERSAITHLLDQQATERLRLTQQMTPPATRPTAVVGEIVVPVEPSKPRKGLVLLLAAVLGVVGGVMLAFVVALVERAKADSGLARQA